MMFRKRILAVTAVLGLTALAATVLAQQSSDANVNQLKVEPNFVQFRPSADIFTQTNHYTHAQQPMSHDEMRLAGEAEQLTRALADAKTDDEKDKIRARISEVLNKQFDQRQQRHEKEIAALEAQVKKLKDQVRLRSEHKRDIIAKRLDQLVQDAEGLGW